MQRLIVAEAWDQFSRNVMPPDAPDVQRRMMRTAFFCGFGAAYGKFVEMAVETKGLPQPRPDHQQILKDLRTELLAFSQLFMQGNESRNDI
jgi:hypothetical protein